MKKIVFISLLVLIFTVNIAFLGAEEDYNRLKAEGKLQITEQTSYSGRYPDVSGNVVGQQRGLLIPLDGTFDIVPFSGYSAPDYRNDDGYTEVISLPFNFCFYGDSFNEIYINNNGNISFNGGYWEYSSSGFPIADFPMLAPFWGDVDTRPAASGLVYYRIESNRVTVIWDHVGYYGNHVDLLNTFELIFTDGTDPLIGVGNNVAFSYGDMQWTTGDASDGSGGFGGIPATVGINRGDGVDFALIGRFDHSGADYDGPGGNNDGVDYLDNLLFTFNVCTQTSNVAPIGSGFPATIPVILVGETYNLTVQFVSPEVGQTTATIVDATGLSNFTHTSTPGNPSVIDIQIIGALNNLGYHNIQFTATDDGIPPMSTIMNLVIEIIEGPADDPNIKWKQNPDPLGWDVYAQYPMILADDFLCTETELVKDIHFWGSWFADDVGEITSFDFNIY